MEAPKIFRFYCASFPLESIGMFPGAGLCLHRSAFCDMLWFMNTVIVAEKPSVGRDIARVLGATRPGDGCLSGNNYIVTWALGHLVSLVEPDELDERYRRWRMADLPILPADIPLKVLPATRSQFAIVKKLMNDKDTAEIVCATDAAREGELIFRYIYRMAGCKKPVKRLWISSMTDAAIRKGFAELRPAADYDALYESARCRSLADWLVGMNASRAFTLRYGALLPMGRVQTPTLALLVKRDREIAEFVPRDYWEVRANFGDFEALYYDPEKRESRAATKEQAEKIKRETQGKEGEVVESRRELKRVPPPRLYDLTTLQREANRRFGFSADKTLKIAQALYERHKAITYPRTDSRCLPPDMREKALKALWNLPPHYRPLVQAPAFNRAMNSRRFYDASKVSDHHAIIPTERRPGAMHPDEEKVYDLVARSLIAAHYPDYAYESTRLRVMVGGHEFRATGSVPRDMGWRAVIAPAGEKEKEAPLPDVREGETRVAQKVSSRKKQTKPPERLTDATLLSLMEHAGQELEDEELRERMKASGLGTPATRAATIERLLEVGLAQRSGKSIVSTEKGRKLISVAPEQITSAATTGKWEKALNDMAHNPDAAERDRRKTRFMEGIRRFTVFLVDAAKQAPEDVRFEREAARPKKSAGKTANAGGKRAVRTSVYKKTSVEKGGNKLKQTEV